MAGLTDIQQALIKAIAEKDYVAATGYAKGVLAEDETKKGKWFKEKYLKILNTNGSMIELPFNVRNMLVAENVEDTFNEARYYATESEKKLYAEIDRMYKVSMKLLENGIPYLNAAMLYGESGTGKSTFGRYVAYKKKLPFVYMNFSKTIDSYMGKTSQHIADCFEYARLNPCVFMLDEIDCISVRRTSNADTGADGELGRVTITIMQELDKLPNDVIVLGATNRADRIDEAIMNRFSVVHEIKKMNEEDRIALVKKYLTTVNYAFSEEEIREIASEDISQRRIVKKIVKELALKIEKELDKEEAAKDGSAPTVGTSEKIVEQLV